MQRGTRTASRQNNTQALIHLHSVFLDCFEIRFCGVCACWLLSWTGPYHRLTADRFNSSIKACGKNSRNMPKLLQAAVLCCAVLAVSLHTARAEANGAADALTLTAENVNKGERKTEQEG